MALSAFLLSLIGLLLGLLPLWPSGSVIGVIVAALGVLPAISGFLLALANRSEALRQDRKLGAATATLALSVVATLLCAVWLLALVVVFRSPRGRGGPTAPLPSPQTAARQSAAPMICDVGKPFADHPVLAGRQLQYTLPT